jgi:pimeloyl-ACP methyl ester carboxylesterase
LDNLKYEKIYSMMEKTDFDRTFSHHMAAVNGVKLHFVKGGTGEAVVLLHGFPQTWYEWHRIMPALAERYTVIAPDLRGMGASSKPTSGYDNRTVAEDIYQLVCRLGLAQISIVGHDVGAPVGYAYAAAHPEGVRRLVTIESVISGTESPQMMEFGQSYWHMGFHAEPDIAESLIVGRERIYLSWFYRKFGYNPAAFTEDDIDEYVRWYSAVGAMRSALQYYRYAQQDFAQNKESKQRKLPMPVLTIGGEHSLGSYVEVLMQDFASNIRGSVIKDCGHWIAEEQPEELTRQLLTFFSE